MNFEKRLNKKYVVVFDNKPCKHPLTQEGVEIRGGFGGGFVASLVVLGIHFVKYSFQLQNW